MANPDSRRLDGLQMLRFFAAFAVLLEHVMHEALSFGIAPDGLISRLEPVDFGVGVDVFFVISGFIMLHISADQFGRRGAPRDFLLRRVARLVPLYWLFTLAMLAAMLLVPGQLAHTALNPAHILASFGFVPWLDSTGLAHPILGLGWTLNYEMYFYALFAISLLIWRSMAAVVCSVLITLILLAIDLSGATHPSVTFYARPIVFEFVFGVAAYYLVTWITGYKASITKSSATLWLLALVMAGAIAVLGIGEYQKGWGLPREISAGVPAFFLVASAILIERLYRVVIDNKIVFLVGESSYILYLVHPYVIYGILRTLVRHPENLGALSTAALILALLAIASVVAVAIHLLFERPVMDFLRRRFLKPRVKAREDAILDSAPAVGGAYAGAPQRSET